MRIGELDFEKFYEKERNNNSKELISTQSFGPKALDFEKICTVLLREGHKVKFPAPGDSMYPTICNGDIITVAPIETPSINIGDIILYRHKSGVAAHRVIRIAKRDLPDSPPPALSPQSYYILRGDAAVVFDDPVVADQILGKVTSVEREGRRIDPYSFKAQVCFNARRLAARLKNILLFETH